MANSMRIGVTLSGFKEATALLRSLPAAVESRVLASAIAVAARPIVNAAKAKAPVRTGALKKSITAVVRRYPRTGTVMAVIGPDTGYYSGGKKLKKLGNAKGADRPANYAHLVEFGHYSRVSSGEFGGFAKGAKRRKSATGRVAQEARSFILPKPFLRPAVMSATPAASAALASGVEKGMEREIKRLSRKMNKLQLAG